MPFGSSVDIRVEEPEYAPGPVRVTTNSQVSPPWLTIHVPAKSLAADSAEELVVVAGPEVIVPDLGLSTPDELFEVFFAQATHTSSTSVVVIIFVIVGFSG